MLSDKQFEVFYQENSKMLFHFLLHRTDADSADDILQESFYQFWRRFEKAQLPDNPKAYLFTIARNLLYKRYKQVPEGQLGEWHPDEKRQTTSEVQLEQLKQVLKEASKSLAPELKEVVELRWMYGFAQNDVAQILNFSTRHIRRLQEKALEELKIFLEKENWKWEDVDELFG